MYSKETINQYKEYVNAPWGKLFYRVLHKQIETSMIDMNLLDINQKILDFGSGFGITSEYFSNKHSVIAIESNKEMIQNHKVKYEQIIGSINELKTFPQNTFDSIFCHNVLEYVDNNEEYLIELIRVLKPNGILSLVCHNFTGKIISTCVVNENPSMAFNYINKIEIPESDNFGKINYLNFEILDKILKMNNCIIKFDFGIRIFWGIIKNNKIKYDLKWNEDMYNLEIELSNKSPFKDIGFWKHYIISK